jgi:carboxyl-terminal processing protease
MDQQSSGRFPAAWVLPLVLASFAAGVLVERFSPVIGGRDAPSRVRETFQPFWETWSLVDEYYVDRNAVNPQKMTRGAIVGMLNSLGDVGHTTYLTPEEVQELETSVKGHYEGIGARMTVRQKQPTIVETMPNSPARKAGLRRGDVIIEVDGKSVRNLSLDKLVQLVRGQAGTEVQLRILRPGRDEPIDFAVIRDRVEIPDISWTILPGTAIAHLAIHDFGAGTTKQLREAVHEIRKKGGKGLIVDVRGNPGGLKEQAVAVTSQFLKSGDVFIEVDARGNKVAVPVLSGGIATDMPMCVLMDEGTASSAEILVGAIQDHGRAKLIGTKTFGTGTVLKPFPLRDGSAVLLAISEWLTPKGRQIWHKGISPDIEVELPFGTPILVPDEEATLEPSALERNEDKQLLKGLELLKKQIGS